jgi:DNA-binding response OmpR family regulator
MIQTQAISPFTGLRVLVVDDEYLVAAYIETLLEDLGCEVVGPVATIAEGLAIVRTERLDGALLDANLNGDSSAPIAAELRAGSIPFVVVTGYGRLKLENDTLSSAPRLIKPFDISEFENMVAATFLVHQA